MLDLIEKISNGISGLLVLLTTIAYGFVFFFDLMPTTRSSIFIQEVHEIPVAPAAAGKPKSTDAVTPEDHALIDKLAEQGVKVPEGQGLKRVGLQVPKGTVDYLSAQGNLIPELDLAKSRQIKTKNGETRLKIYEFKPGSLLPKLGFKENDTVELVDGQILEFKATNAVKYTEALKSAIQKLRDGKSVSVTVTRNNQPVHLEFKL